MDRSKRNIAQQQFKIVFRLKKEKENERRKVEEVAQEVVAPKDPITGETPKEALERERLEADSLQQSMQEVQKRAQKNRETERYV